MKEHPFVVYVDLVGKLDKQALEQVHEVSSYIMLIDNAQKLAAHSQEVIQIVKNLFLDTHCLSSVLAFSPQVVDSQGYSVHKVVAPHENQQKVFFAPFSEDEASKYLKELEPEVSAAACKKVIELSNGLPGVLAHISGIIGHEEETWYRTVNSEAFVLTDNAVIGLKNAFH